MAKKTKTKKCGTYIGGQAGLKGGIMMGKKCIGTAVRDNGGGKPG